MIKEYKKQYYQENKEKSKKYYLENSKKINKVRKKWRKNNPEKQKKYYIKHRERKLKRDKERREEVKQYINNYKLSKGCAICGYKKCAEALVFHHINNGNKEFDVSRIAKCGGNIEKIKSEISKCMVLCSNCHVELHTKLRKKEVKYRENES